MIATGSPFLRFAVASAVLVAAFGLSACNPGPEPIEHFAGVPLIAPEFEPEPEGETGGEAEGEAAAEEEAEVELVELEVSEGEARAIYLEDGGRIALVLWGSSSCPPVGTAMTVVADAESGNAVRVELVSYPEDQPCTQDFVPHTTVFWTPVYITTTQELRIEVGDEEVILPIK